EVSLTLIDPEVYDGADANNATEIEIRDELPEDSGDWDETELRTKAAEETERLTEEAQPGRVEEGEGTASPENATVTSGAAAPSESAEPSSIQNPSVQIPYASSEGHSSPESSNPSPPTSLVAGEAGGPHVVLKIRRRKFQQQFRAGEIVVTRRLFRSGDSEYLLNGKLCRLRDIQELFMGTGLGPESYALIEQGRIGQILSSRPTDRRAIIEEAAGITQFKTKKRLAEARLEDAKQNLARVNDIFEEVTRQMNSLKRQASKAERY